jgi:hypothetical protein
MEQFFRDLDARGKYFGTGTNEREGSREAALRRRQRRTALVF